MGECPHGCSALCHVGGEAWTDVQNAVNFPTFLAEIPSWFYKEGMGAVPSQLVSRVLTKVFWSVCSC